MKYPILEKKEYWEKRKERVLNELRLKGEIFIEENLKKLEDLKKKKKS